MFAREEPLTRRLTAFGATLSRRGEGKSDAGSAQSNNCVRLHSDAFRMSGASAAEMWGRRHARAFPSPLAGEGGSLRALASNEPGEGFLARVLVLSAHPPQPPWPPSRYFRF
jgi:hypothetical protein